MKKNLSGLFIIKKTGIPGITWSQAVDVALCFGWIDSKLLPLNDKQLMQFFCKRKPNSVWSKINKQKVHCLLEEGLMEKAGYTCFYTAKQNGSWVILDKVEEFKIPKDLDAAFKTTADSKSIF